MLGIATAISLAIGVPIGFLVGSNRYARGFEAFLRYLQGVSGIAWLPLVIIWFGFTHRTTLAVVIYTLTVPIIFNYHGRRARGDLLLVGNGLLIISKHSRDLL